MTAAKRIRGFAALPPDVRSAIASTGGKAAHQQGKAHQWTSAEAKLASMKSVAVRQAKRLKKVA